MSRIPGIVDVIEFEEPAPAGVPSLVAVRSFWTKLLIEADRIDAMLASINRKLRLMSRWAQRGFVKADDLAQASEWFAAKSPVLDAIFARHTAIHDTFYEGGLGI